MTAIADVPGLSAPLRRALADAGFNTLADLDGQPRTAIGNLHGVGKVGLDRLAEAMAAEGFALKQGHAVWTRTDRGETPVGKGESVELKSAATEASPAEWIESLPWPRRVAQGRVLLALFGEVTGAEPRMWGPTMVGYGQAHYQYATGRQGESMQVGFSPRKAAISLYGLQFYDGDEARFARLGKHKMGAGCIWVNQLDDIDLDVLRELIARAWQG